MVFFGRRSLVWGYGVLALLVAGRLWFLHQDLQKPPLPNHSAESEFREIVTANRPSFQATGEYSGLFGIEPPEQETFDTADHDAVPETPEERINNMFQLQGVFADDKQVYAVLTVSENRQSPRENVKVLVGDEVCGFIVKDIKADTVLLDDKIEEVYELKMFK